MTYPEQSLTYFKMTMFVCAPLVIAWVAVREDPIRNLWSWCRIADGNRVKCTYSGTIFVR